MIASPIRSLGLIVILSLPAFVVGQPSAVTSQDIFITHTSTVPANRGARVSLFARHYRSENPNGEALIVLSSDILPADAGLGLDFEDDNHLEQLAGRGFDVFAADVTGYGLSPKPQMDDGCNAASATQPLLTPYPLYIPCSPSYTRSLTSLSSDWDEVATIVEHVSEVTGDEQVSLMGWSLGAARAAGYAASNPDSVEQLVLIAPRYAPDSPAEVPEPYTQGPPLRVHEVNAVIGEWQQSVQCDDRADFAGVGEQLRAEVNELDPVAAEWGYDLGSLFRSPGIVGLAGFGSSLVGQISTPTMVVTGLDDNSAADGVVLFEDLTAEVKLRIEVECGSHWLIWEESFPAVREAIAEFLETGAIDGQQNGVMTVGIDGEFR